MNVRPWFEEKPEIYSRVQEKLLEYCPSLTVIIQRGCVYARGTFPIIVDGKEVDLFQIEIQFPSNYPRGIPVVRETAGRLEKVVDRHFNADGTACLFLRDEGYKFYTPESTIVDFMETCVKNFFIWQIDYDLTDGKPTRPARAHGVFGIVEFYKEELQVDSLEIVIKFLEYITSKKVKGHWTCYCGSRKELRRCHIDKARTLQEKIPRDYAVYSRDLIRKHRALLEACNHRSSSGDFAIKEN